MFKLMFFIEIPGFIQLNVINVLYVILDTIILYFYNKIALEETKTWYICGWLTFMILDKILYSICGNPTDMLFQRNLNIAINKEALQKYSKLNYIVKCKEPLQVYKRKISNVTSYYDLLSSFGIAMFINVLSSIIDVYITLRYIPIVLGTICIIMIAFTYFLITDTSIRDARKNHNECRDTLANQIILEETYFEIGKKTCLSIIDIMNKQFDNNMTISNARMYVSDLTVSNELLIIAGTLYVCCHMEYAINIVNVIRVLTKFSSSIKHLSRFFHTHSEARMKHDEYFDFWKVNVLNVINEPIALDFPKKITILLINYQCPENNYYLEMKEELTLIPGDVLKITGGTGVGKSVFCNLMMGRDIINNDSISAMTLEHGEPRQFMHHICECGQDTSTQLNWSVSTIRQHFEGETDDKKILHFCDLMFIKDKVLSLGLDKHIEKSVSGGEQQRITLASNLYFAEKHESKVLIFDEPEKGLGIMAEQILDNLSQNPNVITIISTHATKWSKFTKQLLITKNGNVSKINLISSISSTE